MRVERRGWDDFGPQIREVVSSAPMSEISLVTHLLERKKKLPQNLKCSTLLQFLPSLTAKKCHSLIRLSPHELVSTSYPKYIKKISITTMQKCTKHH